MNAQSSELNLRKSSATYTTAGKRPSIAALKVFAVCLNVAQYQEHVLKC